MTVADLLPGLSEVKASLRVILAVDGMYVPVAEHTWVEGADFMVIRGKPKRSKRMKRFTISEDGLIGHMVSLNLTNDDMAKVLACSVKCIQQRRKRLGF